MAQSPDLFDAAAARAAKKEAMARVEANAEQSWSDRMLEMVRLTALQKLYFTADDVFELAVNRGIPYGKREMRAFGPVMLRAAKAGYCIKADCAPRNSNRKTLHASPRTVWESLIDKGPRS